MTNSSAAPIMTCAKFLHHGGTHAQVHRTPDTRPSVPLRRRLLPATPGLPIRRQGHLRGPRDGPLRRRGAHHLLHLRDRAAASGTHPARRPMPTPCTPTSSASRGLLEHKVNAAFVDHLPRPLHRRRKRPLRLGVDLTLLPYYGQHSLESREIYRSQAKARDQLVLRLRHRLLGPPGPAVHLGRDSRDALGVPQGGTPGVAAPGERGGAQARAVAVGPRLLQRGGHPLPAAGAAAVPHASCLPRPQGRSSQRPQRVERLQAGEEESGWFRHTLKDGKKDKATVWICVKRARWVDRHGRRKSDTWVYTYWGITPRRVDWVKETYRKRFGSKRAIGR